MGSRIPPDQRESNDDDDYDGDEYGIVGCHFNISFKAQTINGIINPIMFHVTT